MRREVSMVRMCWTQRVAGSVTSACCVVESKHSSIMLRICSNSIDTTGLETQVEQGLAVAPAPTAAPVVGVLEEQEQAEASELTDRRPLNVACCG